ncbi:MAG: helix-turn-helix transcriptional regulator [Clostridiales bacterium]|nr:helix-turn-helix transcriptional regulator [Clostridiales bacterium]MCI6935565.1 helix-turn-helix transcriptional regulator [Clostridiales bacterium]
MDAHKFGNFVAITRKENHMTQAELASKLQVTDKAVSRWERGLGFPDINTLEPLAEALGLSVLELMKSERIKETDMQCTDASVVLSDTIKEVGMQRLQERKQERRIIAVSIVLTMVLSLFVLLMDNVGWSVQNVLFTGLCVVLPLMSIIALTAFTIVGIARHIMGKSCKQVFVAALSFAAVILAMMLALFVIGLFAFPGQH